MKVSNILSIVLVVFIVSALVYEKKLLKTDSNKIDRSIQFGEYPNVIPLQFNHVKVKGGFTNGRVELHQRPRTEIRYKEGMKNLFQHHIKNDTLYIDFKEELTAPFYENYSKNKVIVLFKSIASFSFENSQNSMYCKKLSKLKIKGKGLHLEMVDSLDITVLGKTKLSSAASKANHLKVRAKDNSKVKLRILTAMENDIEFEDNAQVKVL